VTENIYFPSVSLPLGFIEKYVIPLTSRISSIVAVYKSELFCSGQ
jgi:hypothetical protein